MTETSIQSGFASENKALPTAESDIQTNRDLAAFCYTLVFAPILLLTRGESSFLRHHAQQACYLAFFFLVFALLPGVFTYLNVLVIAGALMGFLEAQAGHWYRLPLVSSLISRDLTLSALLKKWKKQPKKTLGVAQQPLNSGPEVSPPSVDQKTLLARIDRLESEVERLKMKSST